MIHFTIEEMCQSETAQRLGIKNVPNDAQRANLEALVDNILDPLRDEFKRPIYITSGFRCEKLNSLPSIRGAKNSQHTTGEAADIVCKKEGYHGNAVLGRLIALRGGFDQLIFEDVGKYDLLPKWIHVSYKRQGQNRGQILKKIVGKQGYVTIKINDII